jgi:hypothetical protein
MGVLAPVGISVDGFALAIAVQSLVAARES